MSKFHCKLCGRLLAENTEEEKALHSFSLKTVYENMDTGGLNKELLPKNLKIRCPDCKVVMHFGEVKA